jgi:hypothetical protein
MTRYLSGLCVAGLGLCGGGWLVVTSMAFGGKHGGIADKASMLTGAGLIAVALITLCCWAMAWRRRMRVDGVLMGRFLPVSRREARRNRRELRRDVRETARLARRDARESRKEGGLAQLDLVPAVSGEDAAELLYEIRTLLGPLLTAVEGRDDAGGAPAVPEPRVPVAGEPCGGPMTGGSAPNAIPNGAAANEAEVNGGAVKGVMCGGYPDIQVAQPRYSNGAAFAGDGEESW